MSEYIERDAALAEIAGYNFDTPEYMREWANRLRKAVCADLHSAIDRFPAADVRPVVQSEWIDVWSELDPNTSTEVICPICRARSDRPAGNFCKWCGADMHGGKQAKEGHT